MSTSLCKIVGDDARALPLNDAGVMKTMLKIWECLMASLFGRLRTFNNMVGGGQ